MRAEGGETVREAKRRRKAEADAAGRWLIGGALSPSARAGGGQGFAKPSVFVNLHDQRFLERFTDLWEEHIDGWSGNSYRGAGKRQEQSTMLWKQRLLRKQGVHLPAAQHQQARLKPSVRQRRRNQHQLHDGEEEQPEQPEEPEEPQPEPEPPTPTPTPRRAAAPSKQRVPPEPVAQPQVQQLGKQRGKKKRKAPATPGWRD
mmetsp:Transcript_22395/g.72694  ORF Transcript_22395/g.72694 Transcript_22395/m.72694 type:complete len:202 (-) Transcript_22395:1004-1609(-)